MQVCWICFRSLQVYIPVNKLRNLALQHAQTKYVFQVDVDFLLSDELEREIVKAIKNGFFYAYPQVLKQLFFFHLYS